jgi:bifunctional non-homologous end joining protein LigD
MPARTTKRPSRKKSPAARLSRYHAKRNLPKSGEPAGSAPRSAIETRAVPTYVIQMHDATRLHFDFRLEMDGVLRSWAVPKGIPTKPGERVLAVEVEDHPLEYGEFEGVIPEGNYGAGAVMLWDRGHYTVSGVAPETAYRQGKIHLALSGQKCVGEWTLVRMKPRAGETKVQWLLIKNSGPQHRAPVTGRAREQSVRSGRTLEEIAAGGTTRRTRAAAPPGRARKRAKPPGSAAPQPRAANIARRSPAAASGGEPATFIPPMKALSRDRVPAGKWRLEVKLDGYRAIAVLNAGEVELWSRNHKSLTAGYPELVSALQDVPCANAVIDGEIVALDPEGRSRFQLLQQRGLAGARAPIVYYVFDLLHHDGRSLLERPIEERQLALQMLAGRHSGTIRFSPVFEMEPEKLIAAVRKQGLEGIIAKAAASAYEPDRRSGRWVKVKVHGEQEFVIGGYTPPKNSRAYFGAILVGYFDRGKLIYAGKVGSGFDRAGLAALFAGFQKRRIDHCPFANLPLGRRSRFGGGMTAAAMRGVMWVKPELVAQVRFTEWTEDGSLRHPVFMGLRDDKRAREVVREAAPVQG